MMLRERTYLVCSQLWTTKRSPSMKVPDGGLIPEVTEVKTINNIWSSNLLCASYSVFAIGYWSISNRKTWL